MLTINLHMLNYSFIMIGVTDFKRKLFFQKAMTALINPERSLTSTFCKKIIPCINLVDVHSIRRWIYLRKLSLDFGKRFTYRIFVFCSIYLTLYGILSVIFTLVFFDILPYEIPIDIMILN
jgi:uncharacterized membrane protein